MSCNSFALPLKKQTKEIKPFFSADLHTFFIASSDPELTRFPATVNWSVEETVCNNAEQREHEF